MQITRLRVDQGYPLSNLEFGSLTGYSVERVPVQRPQIEAFERACYRSIVRFIKTRDWLKEDRSHEFEDYYVVYLLPRDLIKLGQFFSEEKEKITD